MLGMLEAVCVGIIAVCCAALMLMLTFLMGWALYRMVTDR